MTEMKIKNKNFISKQAVANAANDLRKYHLEPKSSQYKDAKRKISEWRSYHSYPMSFLLRVIKALLKKNNVKATVLCQRLKRMPSIEGKIIARPRMNASNMQDVAGIRIVLSKISDVYTVFDLLNTLNKPNDLNKSKTKCFEIVQNKTHDYIKSPKADGYRSIHVVFKYECKSINRLVSSGKLIEVQIRTQLQHDWGTAVESLGIINKEMYKRGAGNKEILRFFALVSYLFAMREGCPVPEIEKPKTRLKILKELKTIDKKYSIINKLEVNKVDRILGNSSTDPFFYLLTLADGKNNKKFLEVKSLSKDKKKFAEWLYENAEDEGKLEYKKSVLLLNTISYSDLELAYPNYFLKADTFIKNYKEEFKISKLVESFIRGFFRGIQ